MLAGAQWEMLCTCMTSFSPRNSLSAATSHLCARQSMQKSTPSGNRVSTHTLKAQENTFFSNIKLVCTNFQHLFSKDFHLDTLLLHSVRNINQKLCYHNNMLAPCLSPNSDKLGTFGKIISSIKLELAP